MKNNKWLILIISFFLFLININIVNASSFSISAAKNMTKGGKTKLTIKGSDVIGRFNIKSSNSSVVSISEDRAWIENDSYSITLNALKVGTATITITPVEVSNSVGGTINLGAKSITITVSLPREKSKNNYLKSINIDGYELVPAFDKDTLEYNVSVPSTTEKITINAEKEDKYSTISGVGEFEVLEGANTFEITCTSETGVSKVYAVNVTVEDLNPIEVSVNNEKLTIVKTTRNMIMPDNYVEKTVSITGINIPSYFNEASNITLIGLKNESGEIKLYKYLDNKYEKYTEIISGNIQFTPSKITNTLEGYIKKDININNDKVEALVVSDNSKFAVLYGINIIDGNEGYYVYDMESKSIQKYDSEMIDLLREENKQYLNLIYIAGGLAAISLLIVIILASSNSKKNKLIKKYLDKHENKNANVKNVKIEETKVEVKELPKEVEKKKESLLKEEEKKDINEEIKEKKAKKNKQVSEELEATTYDIFADDKKKKRK